MVTKVETSHMYYPSVSVIVAAYNAERYISETLDSIFAQTFKDYEVIVVDDGSTDRTPSIVAQYPLVTCLQQRNCGQPAARNAGIRAARGRYLAFLDADDLWLPSKLEKQVSLLSTHAEADWVYSDAIVFDSERRTVICRISERLALHDGSVLRELLLCSFIPSPTPLIRREVFDESGLFDESPALRIGEDWNMWLRIAERHPIAVIREPLALVRAHDMSMTQTTNADAIYESKRRIVELAVARNAESLQSIKARALAALALSAGLRHLRRKNRSAARAMFLEVIRRRLFSPSACIFFAATCLPSFLVDALQAKARQFRANASPRSVADLTPLTKRRGLA
jgi:glycosyltransferase involved in cell wall biosynthesis